jgi:hypothetical protein
MRREHADGHHCDSICMLGELRIPDVGCERACRLLSAVFPLTVVQDSSTVQVQIRAVFHFIVGQKETRYHFLIMNVAWWREFKQATSRTSQSRLCCSTDLEYYMCIKINRCVRKIAKSDY